MTLAWMCYTLIVSGCFALAAYAAEWILCAFRRPARWVWAVAIVLTVVVPMMVLLPGSESVTDATVATLTPQPMSQTVAAAFEWTAMRGTQINTPVLFLWGSTSILLLVAFAWSAVRIGSKRRTWRSVDIAGRDVLVSRATGPAIVGVRPSTIVIPEWVLDLEADLQRLIVRHEEEHRRARDLWLALGAIVTLVAFPWNLVLWWQSRRMRLAIEIDCDRRVLQDGVSVRSYAELLLASAQHPHLRIQPVTMALAESATSLERRIDDMTRTKVRSRASRSILHGLAALGLVVVACDTPVPDAPLLSDQSESELVHLKRTKALEEASISNVRLEGPTSGGPLYVIDGVMVRNNAVDIDKRDIESVEVVKGAAAVALYGSRASNGVVHIRTLHMSEEKAVNVQLRPMKERPGSGN